MRQLFTEDQLKELDETHVCMHDIAKVIERYTNAPEFAINTMDILTEMIKYNQKQEQKLMKKLAQ